MCLALPRCRKVFQVVFCLLAAAHEGCGLGELLLLLLELLLLVCMCVVCMSAMTYIIHGTNTLCALDFVWVKEIHLERRLRLMI